MTGQDMKEQWQSICFLFHVYYTCILAARELLSQRTISILRL